MIAAATRHGFLERPGCRVYYELTGSGPAVIFAHGIGSNHMTWLQQIAHFSDRYACVTFSHRGYPPGSEIGVPNPKEFAGDLAPSPGRYAQPARALEHCEEELAVRVAEAGSDLDLHGPRIRLDDA